MLNNIDSSPPNHLKKKEIKRELKQLKEKMIAFQKKMNAQGKYSLLLVFQGMDASGKDGATRRVLEGVNPSGIKVKSYKKPTDEEFAHDFLWRVHKHLPEKGMVQVFNRSHYEDILVPSVYGYLDKKIIQNRFNQINDFERMLEENGTKIIKIYLNVSYEKQEEKLFKETEKERLEEITAFEEKIREHINDKD